MARAAWLPLRFSRFTTSLGPLSRASRAAISASAWAFTLCAPCGSVLTEGTSASRNWVFALAARVGFFGVLAVSSAAWTTLASASSDAARKNGILLIKVSLRPVGGRLFDHEARRRPALNLARLALAAGG